MIPPDPFPRPTVVACTSERIDFQFSLDKVSYFEEETIEITISFRNVSDEACWYSVPDGGSSVSIEVRQGKKWITELVDCGMRLSMVMGPSRWDPGKGGTTTLEWNQRESVGDYHECDFSGPLIGPGSFQAVGRHRGLPRSMARTISFEICAVGDLTPRCIPQ